MAEDQKSMPLPDRPQPAVDSPDPAILDKLVQDFKANDEGGNTHPVRQINLLQKMIGLGQTEQTIPGLIKKSQSTVSDWLKCAALAKELLDALLTEDVSKRALLDLVKLNPTRDEQLDLAKGVHGKSIPPEKLARLVSEWRMSKEETSAPQQKPPPGKKADAPEKDQPAKKTSIRGKDSQDKTTGELLVSVIIGLFFVPGYLYCWLVRQRAAADLKELEERAYINAVSIGTWNFVRWVVVGVILLLTIPVMFWATWPRIKQGIHWIHTLKTAATTIAPAPAPQSATPLPVAANAERGIRNSEVGRPVKKTPPSALRTPNSTLSSTAPSPAVPLVTAGDATNVMQSVVPQKQSVPTRFANAVAIIAGKAVTAPGAPAPAAKKLAPGPKNLRWRPNPGTDSITIEWDPMGTDYHYRLYASPFKNPSFDQDPNLFTSASLTWTPPPGVEKLYLFYVTAINSQGEESAPSQRLFVDNQ
jgi:hypothetical protein